VQGQICYILTPASYESLPAPLATQITTLWVHTSGGRGLGGALILDRCRAFDLFASVDAHLCRDVTTKLSLGGNNDAIAKLFLPRGSLVSDIPQTRVPFPILLLLLQRIRRLNAWVDDF
jgi:hypothetical protein